MTDEDEIDILGDYSLDSILSPTSSINYESSSLITQNGDLLNCDYTIHPQWLLDKPSTDPDNWYNTDQSTNSNDKSEQDLLGHVSTENSITDESGWTEKEKSLLVRGIEIFGKSHMRLSQIIGSKTPGEVRYYLKNFYLENHGNLNTKEGGNNIINTDLGNDVLYDNQIPASIEEVIAAVSTAKPTIPSRKRLHSEQSLYKEKLSADSSKYSKRSTKPQAKFKVKTKLLKFPNKVENTLKQKIVKIFDNKKGSLEFGKAEITTGKGLSVPVCEGEEIIKLKKKEDDSDSDIEVDIENSDEDKLKATKQYVNKSLDEPSQKQPEVINSNLLNEQTLKILNDPDKPKTELILPRDEITNLEKAFHTDFFEEGTFKTPEKYLRIRNRIIKCWLSRKPEYLNKTTCRQGFRNYGDVNTFGLIHHNLEQIGAINFGCEQVVYKRPLIDLIKNKTISNKEKFEKEFEEHSGVRQQRIKKNFSNDGEGGCTLIHDEQGKVINTLVINKEPVTKQRSSYIRKPTIRLIYCQPFSPEKPQPFSIKVLLSTLLTIDFHAHLSLSEVMGLLAGYWVPETATMIVTHYEPTVNIASSSTHCDMCPISQARAVDLISDRELDILGWFHSHPTFAPEPSQQDLETQTSVQRWIGSKNPSIGFILTPFNSNGALISSPFRCLQVDKKVKNEDEMVPYKFKVEVVSEGFDVEDFLNSLNMVTKFDFNEKVDLKKAYFLNTSLTFLEKYLTSVQMHLAKCGALNQSFCEDVIEKIREFFH